MNDKTLKQIKDIQATEQGRRHANPEIRSMYPSTSRGEMASQFAQLFSLGFNACQELSVDKRDVQELIDSLVCTAHNCIDAKERIEINDALQTFYQKTGMK